jgi:hypothetical protein
MAKKRPFGLTKGSKFYQINKLLNYFTLTVTDLLFCDQAKADELELTGLSFP